MSDPLELLARDDKWYLGSGDGTVFAPLFPVWLDTPGFWDGALLFQYELAPLFTVAILDEHGRELPVHATGRRWTPAELTVDYRLGADGTATETRTVQPGGVFVSEWRLRMLRASRVHLVAFTAQDAPSIHLEAVRWDGALAFERTLRDKTSVPLRVRAELTCLRPAGSWAAFLSERGASQPHWRYTPFFEQWIAEALPRRIATGGINQEGLLYAAVHDVVELHAGYGAATIAMRVAPASGALQRSQPVARGGGDARGAIPPSAGGHLPALSRASRRRWREYFAEAPRFGCSDPYLERYYWYRWYGLRLNSLDAGIGNYAHPTLCEGVGPSHQPVAFSAPGHVRELRWLPSPRIAQGVMRTFFDHQKEDGSLHGRVYVNHLHATDFFHANWGDALTALDAVHPHDAIIAELHPRLAQYAEWLVRARDSEGTGMFDVVDQHETGQEYMSRYQVVDRDADRYGRDSRIRLKGIDATVYAYVLFRALQALAGRAGGEDAGRWRELAERTAYAVRGQMWDATRGLFSDVDPRTGRRTNVGAAVCFYPYLTDLVDAEHVGALEQTLLDPGRFWTPYPVPSSPQDDPLFDPHALWKGKRHGGPWNGRVWPMTNSHVAEALARCATTHAPRLRPVAAAFITRFVRMMFHDGDLDRPNSFEHYNPFTGQPSVYRGLDDNQHSWVNDLLIQYVAGVRPHPGGVTIDPLPFGLEYVELDNVAVRGKSLRVRIAGNRFAVGVDGSAHEGRLGTPVEIPD